MQDNDSPLLPQTTIVVDDTPATARAIRAFLEDELGAAVAGVAHSGEKAVQLARDVQPDLALVDLFMPGESGLEVIKRVRAVSPKTRVIVVTVLGEEMSGACATAGVNGFVVKNRLRDGLAKEIRRVFSARA